MDESNQLIEKFNFIVNHMPHKNKYYHLKSMYNFLQHFNEIPDRERKEKVFNSLNEYLNYITENDIVSTKECRHVFFTFIEPVGLIYKKCCGFSYILRPQSLVVYLIALNLIFFLFKTNPYFYILNILGFAFIYLMYKRSKSSRVYTFNW